MKKIYWVFLFVLILLVALGTGVAQANDEVLVVPYFWDPNTLVTPDTTVIFGAGWATCRRGAIQSFLTAVEMEWILDEVSLFNPDEENQYWGPVGERSPGGSVSACLGKTPENLWGASWRYTYGTFEKPGVYQLDFHWWVTHPISDIADYDGDGKPDFWTGDLGQRTIYITVTEAP